MNYLELSDEQLVILSNKGDIEATNTLLYRYKTMVKSYARKYYLVGGDTDDLIQEGMVALYNSIYGYSSNKSTTFKTFSTMCIKRQFYDAIKSATRNKHKPLNEFVSLDTPTFENKFENEYNPETIFLTEEALSTLENKIKNLLNDEEKQIFELYMEGLSYLEIANTTNVSIKRVDNKLQKIKHTLKASLK